MDFETFLKLALEKGCAVRLAPVAHYAEEEGGEDRVGFTAHHDDSSDAPRSVDYIVLGDTLIRKPDEPQAVVSAPDGGASSEGALSGDQSGAPAALSETEQQTSNGNAAQDPAPGSFDGSAATKSPETVAA